MEAKKGGDRWPQVTASGQYTTVHVTVGVLAKRHFNRIYVDILLEKLPRLNVFFEISKNGSLSA